MSFWESDQTRREAVAAGFTQEQADLMVKYMSFAGHVHEYVNNGFQTTTREGYFYET